MTATGTARGCCRCSTVTERVPQARTMSRRRYQQCHRHLSTSPEHLAVTTARCPPHPHPARLAVRKTTTGRATYCAAAWSFSDSDRRSRKSTIKSEKVSTSVTLNLTLIGSHSLRVEVPNVLVWYFLTSALSVVAITGIRFLLYSEQYDDCDNDVEVCDR